MAQLRKSVSDGHLFILAGQSQGTWQVGEKGKQWLWQNNYTITDANNSITIEAGTFSWLRDKGYLYIYGIEFDRKNSYATLDFEEAYIKLARSIPIVLHQKGGISLSWELALDLSELNESVWVELNSHLADTIIATSARQISRRQLIYSSESLLPIYPFPGLYQLFSIDKTNHKRLLQQAPEIPGLLDNAQGNIFIERATQRDIWERRIPGSTNSFSEELLWLAKTKYEPEWPGLAEKIGSFYPDWQLWRLSVNKNKSVSWKAIESWFKFRSMNVVPLRQRLEIVNPPSSILENGHFTIEPEKSLWIMSYPSSRRLREFSREFVLSVERVNSINVMNTLSTKTESVPCNANQVNYFRWSADQPGDYRIRIQGDASAEPLRVQVAPLPETLPEWLHSLSCTVVVDEDRQTMHAFNDAYPDDASYIMDHFDQDVLARLEWSYKPEGLPISITWNSTPSDSQQSSGGTYLVQSSEELTWYWNEKIHPAIALDTSVKVVLDASSFGSITFTFRLPPQKLVEADSSHEDLVEPILSQQSLVETNDPRTQVEKAYLVTERQITRFSWLNQIISGRYGQKPVPTPMPTQLRERLRELSMQPNITPAFQMILEHLASAYLIPSWTLFQLQALMAEIDDMRE
jgi:hypothetical protein